MRPTAAGRCANHEPSLAEEQSAHRREGGKLRASQRALAAEKVAAIARLGVDTLPDLSTVHKVQAYLVSIAARVEAGILTPRQATALTAVVRLSKDMLALETDIKLLEELEQAKKGKR
jgi:hypothetical protein